jgi:hypothetical protein
VVDDADLQVQLSTALLTRLAFQPNRPPLRLLLLVRSQGAWWEQLVIQTDGLAEDYAAQPRSLEAGALTLEERKQHRDTAAAVFAAQLPGDHSTAEVPVLTDPVFANPLLVHMNVLLALLGQSVANAAGGSPRIRVLKQLLRREHKRWTNSLPGAGLADLGNTVVIQAVAVATLTSPHTRGDTVELLQAVPDLDKTDPERRGRIADWLHDLYPGEADHVVPLRPDLLAEQHLADTPDLVKLSVNVQQHATSTLQVAQHLAELTRAARAHPVVRAALNQLLDARLPELFDQTLGAATSPMPGAAQPGPPTRPHPAAASLLAHRPPHNGARP